MSRHGRFLSGFASVPAAPWNHLAGAAGAPNPFIDHRFYSALEQSGCIGPGTGWAPRPLVWDESGLQAALPLFIKHHSRGEFVFDWPWARASENAGLAWYPKLLIASPFSPVTGPRLLGAETRLLEQLIETVRQTVDCGRMSSASMLFIDERDRSILRETDWLPRHDWQFHWPNRGYRDFEDFLDTLQRKPRKEIRRERRLASQSGWSFEWHDGSALGPEQIDLLYDCYRQTFRRYGNPAPLNRLFFQTLADSLGTDFLLCSALRAGRARAAAVFLRSSERLYGRYWGSLEATRHVHFECCYYQGIEYCIQQRLGVFEPGAQGEHKYRRGFAPVKTHSAHYIRHPGLRAAIANWLAREAKVLQQYRSDLEALNPYGPADQNGTDASAGGQP